MKKMKKMKLTKRDLYRLVESIVNKKFRMRKLNESEAVSTSLLSNGFKIITLHDPETLFATGEDLDAGDRENLKENFRIAKSLIKESMGPLYLFEWSDGVSWNLEAILDLNEWSDSVEDLFHYANPEDMEEEINDILNGKEGTLYRISQKEALQYVRDAESYYLL